MVFGHLTVTAAAHREWRRLWPSVPVSLGALVVGAYLPDLIDKPIGFLTGLSGRGYGHSILVQLVLFAAAWPLLPRYRATVYTLAIGAMLHLIEDWPGLSVVLAPLLGPIPFMPPRGLLESILTFYRSGGVLVWIEVVAAVYWVTVGLASRTRRSRREAELSSIGDAGV
jgi:hypothetical protein